MVKDLAAVILAAGQGTRLKSTLPKVLHRVAGIPMVEWSIKNAQAVGADPIVLVVGYGAEQVKAAIGDHVLYAIQDQRLGTAHATLQAKSLLENRARAVLVLYGDMPTLKPGTVRSLVELHLKKKPTITMLSARSTESMGFGRVVRDSAGRILEIVEEAVATPEILALTELNCGVYCFDADWLWDRLDNVPLTQPKGEYYLTDTVGMAVAEGRTVEAFTIDDITEVQGVNTRVHLARAEQILRRRINEQWMLAGVTMLDPATTYIEADVEIGVDTVIYPNTILQGQTRIGKRCIIGPNTMIRDSRVSNECRVICSILEEAIMEEGADIGPFGHLRPGAHLAAKVHMGNFGEVKASYIGQGSKLGHFCYIGDAQIGEKVNIGAGTITCNFDGQDKQRTFIESGAFIGSGTMLVAPVRIGKQAKIGAGSVVTHDVDDHTLVYGVPARSRDRNTGKEANNAEPTAHSSERTGS